MNLAQAVMDAAYRHAAVTEAQILGDSVQPGDAGAYFLGRGTYNLYHAIGVAFRPAAILEIGVRYGYSLRSMAAGSGRVARAYGFDNEHDHAGSLDIASRNVAGLIADARLFNVDTQAASALPVDGPVDLAHVDGWHTGDGCYRDCCLAAPHLKPGGVLVVDDAGGEVRDGADRFCEERGLTPHYLPCFTEMYLIEWRA